MVKENDEVGMPMANKKIVEAVAGLRNSRSENIEQLV